MQELERLTLGQVLEKSAAESPDKVAVVDGDSRKTYSELNAMADALAAGLAEIGFKKGDRVAIYMKNSLEFVVAFYALQKLGIIVVWINAIYRKREARFTLNNSEAKGVFIFSQWDGYNYLAEILKIKKELPELDSIIVADNGMGEGVYSFEALMDKGSARKVPAVPIDPQEDLCMLLYTSGTTGQPKGAMITHYAAVRAAWEYSIGVQATSKDIFIGFLPMSHSYGCGSILIQPVLLQSIVVLMDKFEIEKAFQIIEREKITLQLGESICVCVIPNAQQRISLEEIREFMKDKIAPHKLPDELCIMDDFPKLSGGVKIKKFGKDGLTELAQRDENRERFRK
jgi:fatty-acyl-CoA synthase/long-chain acyl-CoA synthetase